MVARKISSVYGVVAFLLVFFPDLSQTAACGFTTFSYLGSCTSTCPQGLIADTTSRECRAVNATDIHPDGYTVNATKYEAVAFVNDVTMMVQGGTYLLTIEVIPTTLDTTKVREFITNINGTGTENVDFQGALGALANQVVLRTRNLIPPGNHSFIVGLQPVSFILPGPFTTLEREVELWILPPAQPCSSTLCSNGGHCSDVVIVNVETFSCNCTPGWTGPTCGEDIDFCASQPCMNGGTCIDTENGFTCNCTDNYTGPACADIDHCAAYAPCQNDGQCVNTVNTYNCICGDGWTGKNCTNDVDECRQPSTCQNGGNCTNIDGSYNCSCAPLYTGRNCEIFMPCISNPCIPTPSCVPPRVVYPPTNRIIEIALIAGFGGIFPVIILVVVVMVCCIGIVCYRSGRCTQDSKGKRLCKETTPKSPDVLY